MLGAGNATKVKLSVVVPVQPFAAVTVTVYKPAVETEMLAVFSLVDQL